MRLGLVVAEGREAEMARIAEGHGLFGVLAGSIIGAVYASTATDFVRVVATVHLGLEHPVTIAEELAILDNVNNGRTVVLVDAAALGADEAADEVAVLREALGNRPLRHEGPRWKVPAGLPDNVSAPKSIAVTPKPAQLEIPFWISGDAAPEVARHAGLPRLARDPAGASAERMVQPAITRIAGSLDEDRAKVVSWADAGATHLLLELPRGVDEEAVLTMVSRYLSPEVAMPHFPRVMSNSKVPLPWPGEGGVG